MSNPFKAKHRKLTLFFVAIFWLMLLFNCSLLKIIGQEDPLTPEEHLTLGLAYEKKGDLDLAIKKYSRAAIKLPIAYLYLGNAHFLKNELKEAEAYYKKIIEKDPDISDAYNNLAWLYYTKRQNLDEAERLALKAIEINPAKDQIYRDTLDKIRKLKKPQ